MDLQDLHCFVAIAETGSINGASQRLNRVQSGLSVRLKQLETHLGQPLFDRVGKSLQLNPTGERFLDAARDLLHRAEQLEQLGELPAGLGRLRLASMESTAASHLPALLGRYHRQHPAVQLSLRTQPSWLAVEALHQGELDAAFISADAYDDRLDYRPAFKETLVLVTDKAQPPLRRPDQAAHLTLLTFGNGCAYRERLDRWLQGQHRNPLKRVELGSYHAMLSCAAAGMGVALVPEAVLKTFAGRRTLQTHALPKAFADDTTCMVSHPARQSAALKAMHALLESG